jgi:hypothetical protein
MGVRVPPEAPFSVGCGSRLWSPRKIKTEGNSESEPETGKTDNLIIAEFEPLISRYYLGEDS